MQKIFDLLSQLRGLFTDKAHELLTRMSDEIHSLSLRVAELEGDTPQHVDTRPDLEPFAPKGGITVGTESTATSVTPQQLATQGLSGEAYATATPAEVAAAGGPQGIVSEGDTARVDAMRDSEGHTGSGTHDASVVVAADAQVLPVFDEDGKPVLKNDEAES